MASPEHVGPAEARIRSEERSVYDFMGQIPSPVLEQSTVRSYVLYEMCDTDMATMEHQNTAVGGRDASARPGASRAPTAGPPTSSRPSPTANRSMFAFLDHIDTPEVGPGVVSELCQSQMSQHY